LSRKVAVPNNANNFDFQDEKERLVKKLKKSEFLTSNEPPASHLTSSSTSKFLSQNTMEQHPKIFSQTATSSNQQASALPQSYDSTKKNTGIITASSWRIGEAIAKKTA
jgi:hypothetical protein